MRLHFSVQSSPRSGLETSKSRDNHTLKNQGRARAQTTGSGPGSASGPTLGRSSPGSSILQWTQATYRSSSGAFTLTSAEKCQPAAIFIWCFAICAQGLRTVAFCPLLPASGLWKWPQHVPSEFHIFLVFIFLIMPSALVAQGQASAMF